MRRDPNSVTVRGGSESSPWQQGKLHLRMWSKALEEDRDYFCQSIILKIKNKLLVLSQLFWRPACLHSRPVSSCRLLLCEYVCYVLATCGDSLMESRWAIPCKPSENKQMIIRCSIPTISQHTMAFPPRYTQNNSPTAAYSPLCLSESVRHDIFSSDGLFLSLYFLLLLSSWLFPVISSLT